MTVANSAPGVHLSPRDLYLNLLKHTLIGVIYEDPPLYPVVVQGYGINSYVRKAREWGRDVPSQAFSMIGLRRMNQLQSCLEQIVAEKIPGDFIETGVWRGGATILMRGFLAAYGITDRVVWLADSFQGLPQPDLEKYPVDQMWFDLATKLNVGEAIVRANFARFGLLDQQVRFLPGWFKETLPSAPISQLALLRLDGDLYESTWDALDALYPKVAPGGFVLVDDYHFESCRQAITDYRARHGIEAEIIDIDGVGVFWRRPTQS